MQYEFEKVLFVIRREIHPDILKNKKEYKPLLHKNACIVKKITLSVRADFFRLLTADKANYKSLVVLHQSDVTKAMDTLHAYTLKCNNQEINKCYLWLIRLLNSFLESLSNWFRNEFNWKYKIPEIYRQPKISKTEQLLAKVYPELKSAGIHLMLTEAVCKPLTAFLAKEKEVSYFGIRYLHRYEKKLEKVIMEFSSINEASLCHFLLESGMNDELFIEYYIPMIKAGAPAEHNCGKQAQYYTKRIKALRPYMRVRDKFNVFLNPVANCLKERLTMEKDLAIVHENEHEFVLFDKGGQKISTRLTVGLFSMALGIIDKAKIFTNLNRVQLSKLAAKHFAPIGRQDMSPKSIRNEGYADDRHVRELLKGELMGLIRILNEKGNN